MDKRLEQTLLQGGHTEGPETYEKMLAPLAIREMQIKTTMSYHLTQVRVSNITNQQTNVGEDAEKREPSYIVGGNADWCSHCGKQYGISPGN